MQNTSYKENGHSYQDRFHRSFSRKKRLTQNLFYLRKTAIFIKIAPIAHFLEKTVDAKCILLKENGKIIKIIKNG